MNYGNKLFKTMFFIRSSCVIFEKTQTIESFPVSLKDLGHITNEQQQTQLQQWENKNSVPLLNLQKQSCTQEIVLRLNSLLRWITGLLDWYKHRSILTSLRSLSFFFSSEKNQLLQQLHVCTLLRKEEIIIHNSVFNLLWNE